MSGKITFPFHKAKYNDCGPTCLKMIAEFHGKKFERHQMFNIAKINRKGCTMLEICDAAEKIGFDFIACKVKFENLKHFDLPAILYWQPFHFIVLFEVNKEYCLIADPSTGILKMKRTELERNWEVIENGIKTGGIILVLSVIPR